MSSSINERISFINGLDVYYDPAIAAAAASDSATVNGGATVSYVANLEGQMKARPRQTTCNAHSPHHPY